VVEIVTGSELITDRKACIRSALTVASGFPLTRMVNVSSFSVVIRLPNQDFLVSSGDDSGVKWTSSDEAANLDRIKRQTRFEYLTLQFPPVEPGRA
jgi:hypothetical protein